ncbi:MAG: xanthine dehydrogenase small subunit [Ignavibacteriales bacterium]|nr:xanthine dehydrogenase small subunit [Ignavibacteriales bacterium]
MKTSIPFILDGNIVNVDFHPSAGLRPTTTVLNYLRSLPIHRGVKEGCAEGDCGACTVVIGELTADGRMKYRAVDSCLLFLPMLHGKQLITIENLKDTEQHLHPVQQAMVDHHGSQCGFCTPGIVMSMFGLYKNSHQPSKEETGLALAGNLCRCTGYRPIIDAAAAACASGNRDHFSADESKMIELLKSISQESVSTSTSDQRYDQPSTLKEALKLVQQFPAAVVINGASDVALRVTKRFEVIPHIIDLSRVEELKRSTRNQHSLSLGAGLKISDAMPLVRDDYPALHEMLTWFGAEQIRNVATLGGNLGTASPIGDALPVLMAYGAEIELTSAAGSRKIPANNFVLGYRRTERRPDELITAVILPKASTSSNVRSYKISKRRDLDIATLSGGFRLELDSKNNVREIVLAYGGMAERTKRAESTEAFLHGKPWTRKVIEEAQRCIDADFKPISDVRGSAQFRSLAAKNLLMKFWLETV